MGKFKAQECLKMPVDSTTAINKRASAIRFAIIDEALSWEGVEEIYRTLRNKYLNTFFKDFTAYYDEEVNAVNGIDFDDLLCLTYNSLRVNAQLPKFDWIQVDEVQDLNPIQWSILNLLSSDKAHRVFFGDYEQSIFSFLGANFQQLKQLEKNATIHNFSTNFRSPSYIIEVLNRFAISTLSPLWSIPPVAANNTSPDKLSLIYRLIDGYVDDELQYIVHRILPHMPRTETTAILVHTNVIADMVAEHLDEIGEKYFKISGTDIMESRAVKTILAVMLVVHDRLDRASWMRIFYHFAKMPTLKASRDFIVQSFALGLYPTDFIKNDHNFLESFSKKLKSDRIVVFDTETTGLNTDEDDIIQIAAIEIVNGIVRKTFEVYIDTPKDLSESEKIHHISKQTLLERGIDRQTAFESFLSFVGDDYLVAHNLDYDYAVCKSNFHRYGLSFVPRDRQYDSIDLTRRIHSNLYSYKLEYLLKELNVAGVNSHNALDDVKATANLLLSIFSDTSVLFKKRSEFLKENGKTIHAFSNTFTPIFTALKSKLHNKTKLSAVFKEVEGIVNIESSPEINKIPKYMDFSTQEDTLFNLLEKHIADFTKYKESDLLTDDENIVISTIYKAKGLGFENVIITNCNDDMFPKYYSKNVIEDARLFYVALSRSKKRIILTAYDKKIGTSTIDVEVKQPNGELKIVKSTIDYVPLKPTPFLAPIQQFFSCKRV